MKLNRNFEPVFFERHCLKGNQRVKSHEGFSLIWVNPNFNVHFCVGEFLAKNYLQCLPFLK